MLRGGFTRHVWRGVVESVAHLVPGGHGIAVVDEVHAPAPPLCQLLTGHVSRHQTPHHETPLAMTHPHLLHPSRAEGPLGRPVLMRAGRGINTQALADVAHTLAEGVHARV